MSMASEMIEVITLASPSIHTLTRTAPVPVPKATEVLIKVTVASSNVKDWLHPSLQYQSLNSGDDLAGTIHALGSQVTRPLRIGDRVAAFHQMGKPYGAYAEYAIAPEHTIVHIPDNFSVAEASTIPLVATTAALTLFRRLNFPTPWLSASKNCAHGPLIIYGASSALGTFAIKLAKLANIHPLIAIGGGSSTYAKAMLDMEQGDAFVDYRGGITKMKQDVKIALQGQKARKALDCISANRSWVPISQMLEDSVTSRLSVTSGANMYNEPEIPDRVEIVYTYVGSAHEGKYRDDAPKQPPSAEVEGDVDFARQFFEYLGQTMRDGKFRGHPYEVIPGGLTGVEKGLQMLKNNEAKGVKYVYRVADTM